MTKIKNAKCKTNLKCKNTYSKNHHVRIHCIGTWQVLQKVITKKLPKPITCIGESDKNHMTYKGAVRFCLSDYMSI